LRDACNSELGVGTPGLDEYAKDFVIQVLEILTSDEMNRFPSSFYAVAKSENDVKTTEGILASLKYVSLFPKVDKVIHVATQWFEYDENGQPKSVEKLEEGEEASQNLQYQAAVRLLLPLINKRDDVSLKEQIARPDKHLTKETQTFFKKNAVHVDSLTKAYAYSSSYHKKGKKKTRLVHVSNEINKVSREITRALPMQDSSGEQYGSYMEIRYSLRKFLEKLLRRRRSPRKRKEDDDSPPLNERKRPKRSPSKSPGHSLTKNKMDSIPEDLGSEMEE
jgi:hypothetical protein